jgi:hypothetical protein
MAKSCHRSLGLKMARKLHVPKGTDFVNYGDKEYDPDAHGDIVVPEAAVDALVKVAGCTSVDALVVVPAGLVRVIHEDEKASCGWGGTTYKKQADGSYHVPAAAVNDLLAHGFIAVDQE